MSNRSRSTPPSEGRHTGALVSLVRAGLERQKAVPAHPSSPHDCVLSVPTISADTVQLAAYDGGGAVRIRVELPATEDLEQWQEWMLRWVRRRYPTLTLMG